VLVESMTALAALTSLKKKIDGKKNCFGLILKSAPNIKYGLRVNAFVGFSISTSNCSTIM